MRSWRDRAETEVTELGHLFIVARSNTNLYAFLSQELSRAPRIRVVLDRRQGERRQRSAVLAEEQRRAERRHAQLDEDLRNWGLAVASRRT